MLDLALEGLPGRRLKFQADGLEQGLADVPVVLKIPGLGERAGRIGQLRQGLLLIWAALGLRPGVAPVPVRPQAMDRDQPEPGPEGAGPLIVVEPGQLADQRGQDFLDHILRVGSLRDVVTDPSLDERRVKLRHAMPRGLIRAVTRLGQKAL